MNIETKCRDCEAPIALTGIIITDKHIDFSQVKDMECKECGCKWISVRVTSGEYSGTTRKMEFDGAKEGLI
jgi:hypothetical protein